MGLHSIYLVLVAVAFPPIETWWRLTDTMEYLDLADAMAEGDWSSVKPISRRLWPGYPISIALASRLTGVAAHIVGIAISLLGSGAFGYLVARRYGLAVSFMAGAVFPETLMYGSLGFSEGLASALIWAALLLRARTGRTDVGIAMACLATLARPQGAFLLVSLGLDGLAARRWRQLLIGSVAALSTAGLWLAYLYVKTGDPFANVRGYSMNYQWEGSAFTWPLWSFAQWMIHGNVVWPRRLYVLALWLLTLAGLALAFTRPGTGGVTRPERLFLLVFALYCGLENSLVSHRAHPRYLIPVLPIILASLGSHLPRRFALLAGGLLVSMTLALWIYYRQAGYNLSPP